VRSEARRASVERDAASPLTSINAEPMPLRRISANLHTAMRMPCRFFGSAWQLLRYKDYGVICLACGAPEEIRTPDPQIRSLALEMLTLGSGAGRRARNSSPTAALPVNLADIQMA
jgi:hypothetical protein